MHKGYTARLRKSENVSGKPVIMTAAITALQTVLMIAAYILVPDLFGWLIVGYIGGGVLLSFFLHPFTKLISNRAVYSLLNVIGLGAGHLLRFIYDVGKNRLRRKAGYLLSSLMALYVLTFNSLLWLWLSWHPGYLLFSLAVNILITPFVLMKSDRWETRLLLVLFLFSGTGYTHIIFIFANRRFYYLITRLIYRKVNSEIKQKHSADTPSGATEKRVCAVAREASGLLPSHYDGIAYFSMGNEMFDDMIERMSRAEKFIFVEFFIVNDGALLKRLTSVLTERAARGVEVRMIYDYYGSYPGFSQGSICELRRAGVKILAHNPTIPLFNFYFDLNDHRKIVVIDGKCAYTGGVNVSDEYVDSASCSCVWKDFGIRVDGGAEPFTVMFLRTWSALSLKKEDTAAYLPENESAASERGVLIPYSDNTALPTRVGQEMYISVIAGAKERLTVATPYFLPTAEMERALIAAAKRGVDVRLYIPHIPDQWFVYCVTRHRAERLIKHGIGVYTMMGSFLHSKIVLTEEGVMLGSTNIDGRSLYRQNELGIYTTDKALYESALADIEIIERGSIRLNESDSFSRSITERVVCFFCRMFSSYM